MKKQIRAPLQNTTTPLQTKGNTLHVANHRRDKENIPFDRNTRRSSVVEDLKQGSLGHGSDVFIRELESEGTRSVSYEYSYLNIEVAHVLILANNSGNLL